MFVRMICFAISAPLVSFVLLIEPIVAGEVENLSGNTDDKMIVAEPENKTVRRDTVLKKEVTGKKTKGAGMKSKVVSGDPKPAKRAVPVNTITPPTSSLVRKVEALVRHVQPVRVTAPLGVRAKVPPIVGLKAPPPVVVKPPVPPTTQPPRPPVAP